MTTTAARQLIGADLILGNVVKILQDMTSEWDMAFQASLGRRTKLVSDLGFESIDVVQFVVALEEHFQCRGLPFEEFLMTDGRYVDEIEVGAVVDFLCRNLNKNL